ncbi:hypothetical protein BASA61_003412 [Batrachochytrium salamandrivorans]|nr:hypothetical protein BASA61_003412 [Batrachochytrium salamandrivorans]
MAEQANYHLEGMLAELKDLELRGVFTKLEIKSIVKKRTSFEYSIHRKIVKKTDFLKYIEYEINLEKLRKKRKLRLGLDSAPEKGERGITLSDYSIVRRIHQLHQKALKRFSGDIRLWLQYFEWSKRVGSSKALGKSFAKAIQLHPTKPIFWILAATWEFEENSDVESARVLLQRALRINPIDKTLWTEYFKLELLWVQKIKERRRILFKEDLGSILVASDSTGDTAKDDICKDENRVEPDYSDNEESAGNVGVTIATLDVEAGLEPSLVGKDTEIAQSQGQDTDELMKKELTPLQTALLEVMIPRAIYRNAIKAIPNDISFRFSFLEIYTSFGKASAPGLEDIYKSLITDFPTHTDALVALAEQYTRFIVETDPNFPAALKRSATAFQASLSTHPSVDLWSKYISFLSQKRSACAAVPELVRYLDLLTHKGYGDAHASGYSSISLYLSWARSAETEEKMSILDRALSVFPSSSLLWLEKIANLDSDVAKSDTFQDAAKVVHPMEKLVFWKRYCEFLVESKAADTVINTAFKTSLSGAQLGGTADEDSMKEIYLDWALTQSDGIYVFRKLCTEFIKQRLQSVAFFRKCIDIESQQWSRQIVLNLTDESLKTKAVLEKLWEGAIQADRSHLDTWLGYIRYAFEICKDPRRAAQLYWMAGKEVADKDELERSFQELKQ